MIFSPEEWKALGEEPTDVPEDRSKGIDYLNETIHALDQTTQANLAHFLAAEAGILPPEEADPILAQQAVCRNLSVAFIGVAGIAMGEGSLDIFPPSAQ